MKKMNITITSDNISELEEILMMCKKHDVEVIIVNKTRPTHLKAHVVTNITTELINNFKEPFTTNQAYKLLKRKRSISEKTVTRLLQRLVVTGLLDVEKIARDGGGYLNKYEIKGLRTK